MMPTGDAANPLRTSVSTRSSAALIVSIIALVAALIAVGLTAWIAFRPAPKSPEALAYTPSQQADAKAKICAAADLVRKGVTVNTHLQSPGGDGDVTGSLAVQANARLALSGGGQYLLARLDPATPTDLSAAVTGFAKTLMDIGVAATAGEQNTDPEQAARLKAADAGNTRLSELCK